MLRKKQFDNHIQSLEAALDLDDEDEWNSELESMQEPDTDVEDINADAVAPPAQGHVDGERVIGNTNKSSAFRSEAPFRESLEDRLCVLLEREAMRKDWRTGGGSLKAVQPIEPVGTASKHTPPGPKAKADGKLDSRELRAQSDPAEKYNKNRNLGRGIETDETEQTTSRSEETAEKAEEN